LSVPGLLIGSLLLASGSASSSETLHNSKSGALFGFHSNITRVDTKELGVKKNRKFKATKTNQNEAPLSG
jgi:hypothetical protein